LNVTGPFGDEVDAQLALRPIDHLNRPTYVKRVHAFVHRHDDTAHLRRLHARFSRAHTEHAGALGRTTLESRHLLAIARADA
jgi:hypothetical protein